MNKKNECSLEQRPLVALIYGGNSLEAEVSIKSGKNVSGGLDRNRIEVYEVFLRGDCWRVLNPSGDAVEEGLAEAILAEAEEMEKKFNTGLGRLKAEYMSNKIGVDVDKNDFSFTYNGKKKKFDAAYIMIHGNPGENGLLQGYLEMMNVPFNTCSSFVSSITFDKHSCKRFLDFAGIKLAKDVFLRKWGTSDCQYDTKDIVAKLGLPLFVKPTDGGSSFGVTKVKREEDLEAAITFAFKESHSVIIEECISGREMTNGIYRKGDMMVKLPVTEIVTDREFFDYEAKYLGQSKEICPAEISDNLSSRIQDLSEQIYKYLGCSGLVRMEYIVRGEDIYFLEINTVPGMTAMSLVPAQVRVAKIDMTEFLHAALGL